MKDMSIKLSNSSKVVFASMFGIAYGFFIGLSPLGRFYRMGYCYEPGEKLFQYARMQLVTSICGAIAFYFLTSLKIKGWKGFLKTIAVSYLCFIPYSVVYLYKFISNPCFNGKLPDDINAKFLTWALSLLVLIAALSTLIFVPVWIVSKIIGKLALIISKPILGRVFSKKEFISLDLKEK